MGFIILQRIWSDSQNGKIQKFNREQLKQFKSKVIQSIKNTEHSEMRSNLSGNFNSIQLASNSNRDINYLSSMKVSQRLDSRLKSVMPELKGKTSQIYLTIKAHKSFQDSKNHLIKQIKDELQIPTSMEQGEIALNNYIEWSTFQQTKNLLKDQYLDNQLYYIIVPQKHLSWAQTFAKQQRADSDNKKKIHVLGIMKESLYKQKIKSKSKKRIDKVPDYVHYFSLQNPDCSKDIFLLINQHLEQKLKQQDDHIKTWALSNKYAEKKVKKRTVHIYFDQADRTTLQHLYRKYNPKSRSSWLQIHPYSSFYDVVKSIKQRQALNIKQADKAQQIAQQLTSRLIQSKSQIELGSMKSFNLLDNSQLFSNSIQSVSKLNKDDVNVIISRTDFEELDKLVAFVKAQKLKNWELIQINTDSPHFYQKMAQIFQIGKNFQKQYQQQKQQKIIRSKTLYIIAEINDQYTKDLFYRQDNVFHNMELLLYANINDFAILLREGVKSKDNYTVAVVPGGVNTVDYEYQKEIKQFMKQYKNTEIIDNFTFVSTANGMHASLLSASYQNDLNVSRVYHLANNDQNWLQRVMTERDTFFHPFKGLKGSQVYILVKSSKQHLLKELKDFISQSPRLQYSTYIDKQYLAKQLQTIQIKDSAIIITDDECLREAQQVLVKFDQAFIMNITNRKNLKQEVKVFAWGQKQKIFDLLRMIPDIDHKLQSEIYAANNNPISRKRDKRILPKKIQFLPGNTIVVRLPADLTDQESRKMQIRLKKYFQEEIKIQYYKDPSDIRMRNKSIEPITFNILRQKELQYMKSIAKKQVEEKREQFILYTQNPDNFNYLLEKPQFERFRFISNSWPDIEDYILSLFGDSPTTQSIYEDQLIHVFIDRLPCNISTWIQKYIDRTQLKAANNTRFYLKNDIQDVMLMYPSNHRFYYIVQESTTQNDSFNKRKQAEEAIQRCKTVDQNKKLELIVLNSNRNSMRNSQNSVKCVQPDQKAAADWIANIKVIKVDYLNSRPYVLIDRNSVDWYYFLDKYSNLTNRFRFVYVPSKDELRKTIQKIRNKQPAQQIWILVKNVKQYNEYAKVAQKVQSGRNISIILHGDQNSKLQDQRKKMIFCHADRLEVEKFILNPFRRSNYDFFPSSVVNPKVVLAPLNSTYRQFKTIPLNQKQINNWKQLLNADICYCSDIHDLQRIAMDRPQSSIYSIMDAQVQQKNRNDLQNMHNVKRIILNMNSNYNPRALRNNFKLSNKQIYEGAYPAQISEYLKYLRYNIRNSEVQIQKRYPKQLIQIYTLKSAEINDHQVMKYIQKKNDSIVKIRIFQPNRIQQSLDRASNFDYNTIFIGDNTVASAVNQRNRRTNTKFKFFNAKAVPPYQSNNSSQLQTNELDQVKTYIYNLPQKRYERARNFYGKFRLYYDLNNQNKSYLEIIEQIKKVSQRNTSVQLKGYKYPKTLNNQIKDSSMILILSSDQQMYQNLLKSNQNVQYLILNEDQDRNLSHYGNKYFINKHNLQYYYFFNNLSESYGGNIEPLPLKLDTSIDRVLRNIQNLNSQPIIDDRYYKLSLNPPFYPIPPQITNPLDPIGFNTHWLDQNPPTLHNIPLGVASPPTMALGLQWIDKINKHRIINKQIRPLTAPALDIPPSQTGFRIMSQPDRNFPTLSILPKCPAPQIKRFHLAVLFLDIPQFKAIGQMLKHNLEPQQFSVELIRFKNQHQLDQYSKGNASRLNSFDKIVVFLTPEYKKYDNILKVMKSKLDPRMEYFLFDDNFHSGNHQLLTRHLKPYRIKKVKIPYQNTTLPPYWRHQQNFNIFVPYGNRKYEPLKSQTTNIITYNSKDDFKEYLHRFGNFNIIVCDRAHYHNFKQFPKLSPRCILLIQDTADLYQDQFLFYRFPWYSIYYGPNGVQYLRKVLPKKSIQNKEFVKIIYFQYKDRDMAYTYPEYEKVEFRSYLEIYEYMVMRFGLAEYTHWLLKSSPIPELIPLHPKVYLQDKDYMKDFKNNYLDNGYKHKNDPLSAIKSQIRIHQFADLHQYFYKDHKQLTSILQSEQSPCVVLINGSNNRYLGVKQKFKYRHKFISIVNDSQRWIDRQGYLMEVQDIALRRKQDLFLRVFNEKVFDSFNDFQYYYLSNKADVDRRFNIYFRTKEDLQEIFERNPNLLMVVFVESCDRKHVPQTILRQSHLDDGRVKIIYLQPDFQDDDRILYVKFDQIDPVIIHINRIQFAGRRDYIVFRESDGDKKRRGVIMQRHLQNVDSKPFNSMDDIQVIGEQLKGQYKKVYVICFPNEREDIERIFQKYSIKNKPSSSYAQNAEQAVQYFFIDQVSTINPAKSNIMMNAINSNIIQNSSNIISPRKNQRKISDQNKKLSKANYEYSQRPYYDYDLMPVINQSNSENNIASNLKIQKLIQNKNFILSINQKLKNKLPIGKFYARNIQYFNDVNDLKKNASGTPQLIISNQKYNDLQDICQRLPSSLVVYVSNDKKNLQNKNNNAQNTLIITEQEVPTLIKKLQGQYDYQYESPVSDDELSIRSIDDYQKIRIIYDQTVDPEQKRKLLSASVKNKKIFPTKFKDIQTLTQYMKQPNSLVMLMMDKQPIGLDKKLNMQDYKIVKKRKMKMLLPKRTDQGIEGLQTILEEDENDNQHANAVQNLSDQEIEIYLNLIERKPNDERQNLLIQEKSRSQIKQIIQQDQITKLNVHSNIRPEDVKLFGDDEIQKIKQRLDGNLIVLVIQHSKKDEVRQITNKYNILVQNYTNALNLQNDLRDRKDSVTIAVINKKMIQKIIPLKKKYKQVTFILENDTPQQELVESYKPYIAGQIKKMSDLQKIIAQLYAQNERIRYNQHSIRLASRFQNKRPSVSVVDYSNNQKLSNAINNQKSKKAFLFYKEPQNTHVKLKLMNDVGSVVSFIPYKNVASLKNTLGKYNSYTSIVVANGQQIPEIQDFISKKKDNTFVIRFNAPQDCRDSKVKRLFSTYKKNDLQDYLYAQFMKIGNISSYERLDSKFRSPPARNIQVKKYTQKYQPNAFGTTPRFPGDFVPPKSMKQTYSHRYMKSQSRSKMGRDDSLKSKNLYFQS